MTSADCLPWQLLDAQDKQLNVRIGVDYGPKRKWAPDTCLLDAAAIPRLSLCIAVWVDKHMRTRLTNISVIPNVAGLPGVEDPDPRYAGRYEARLAKAVDINQFGVNIITLMPSAFSANRHWHEAEDEMVYVLDGSPTLVDENGRHKLKVGDIVGFLAGEPNAHHIINDGDGDATLMVVGSRKPGQETIHYPDDNFGPVRK